VADNFRAIDFWSTDKSSAVGERGVRWLSALYLAAVALCLLLPLAQTIHPPLFPRGAPIDEHRLPKPFPGLHALARGDGTFAKELNSWFDERVGFRDVLIRAKNQIDYSLFATAQKTYVGGNGWLYTKADFTAIEHQSPVQLAAIESHFTALADNLVRKGIRLVVVAYADKSRTYPEWAPSSMPMLKPGGNYDELRKFLAGNPAFNFIDAGEIINEQLEKTPERLFAKTDMHPTVVAQAPVISKIVERIASLEGRTDIRFKLPGPLMHITLTEGGETRFLPLLVPVVETDYPTIASGGEAIGSKQPDGVWTVPGGFHADRRDQGVGRAFDWEFRSNPELCRERLPGTVLFGNSFSDLYWSLGMHHSFCFIRRARDPMARFKLFYQTMPADTKYMIFEFTSFWLPSDAPPPPEDYAN
jgi:hypothetical protein